MDKFMKINCLKPLDIMLLKKVEHCLKLIMKLKVKLEFYLDNM